MSAISSNNATFFSSNIGVTDTATQGQHAGMGQGRSSGNQQAPFNNQQVEQQIPLINNLLQQVQADTLAYTREEEKLARDVYKTLGEQWGINSFNNIANSEQQHMDAMGKQLANYGLEDPVKDDSVGAFSNPDLADLYQQLIERGSQSPQEALQVGAYIEELDMLDLQQAIDEADQPGLVSAYENLLKGSRNHMRSFVGQIENQGVDYQAQILPQATVDQITSSGLERGNVGGGGRRGK
ncbi:MAG: DUF2202 domain-containing protein [Thiothrix sp.]